MFSIISVIISLFITFYNPRVPSHVKFENLALSDKNFGFPLQYFEGEILSVDESKYRIRARSLYTLIILSGLSGLAPQGNALGTPVPIAHVLLQKNQFYQTNFSVTNFLKIAQIYDEDSNEIVLTNSEIEQLDFLITQVRSSLDEAILQLRGGDISSDMILVAILIALQCARLV